MKGRWSLLVLLLVIAGSQSSAEAQRDVDAWLQAINGKPADPVEEAVERELREELEYKPQPREQEYKRQEQEYRQQPREQGYQPPIERFQPQPEERYPPKQVQPKERYPPQQVPANERYQPPPAEPQAVPLTPYTPRPQLGYPPQQPVQEYKPPTRLAAQQRSQPAERPPYPRRNPQKRIQQGQQQYPNRPRPGRRPIRRRPEPPANNGGLLNNIVKGAVDTVGGAVDAFSCGTQNLFAEAKLEDEAFITKQFECVRGVGCCDNIGRRIKFLAPEVLRGRCPGCKPCEEKQINRVMSTVSNKYSAEWSLLMTEFRKPGGGRLQNSAVKSCQ